MLILDRLALVAERLIALEIADTSKKMIESFEATGNVAQDYEHQKRIESILRGVWSESVAAMASRVSDLAQSKGRTVDRKKDKDRFELFVLDYIQRFGAEKILQISQTTRTQILDQILMGREAGLGQREIAKSITQKIPTISKMRANVIARTETHSSANYGSLKQAEDSGLQMQREWIASIGNRTRESHAQADGQIVGMDEPFKIGGARLMYPGDPSSPPEESINCRCAVGYVVVD